MTLRNGFLDVRMRRTWIAFIAIAVPALAAIAVAGSVSIATGTGSAFGRVLGFLFVAVTLGGLCVVPGAVLLWRYARGVPDVRFDSQGVTWGRDRARDLTIDWSEISSVEIRVSRNRYGEDRIVIFEPNGRYRPRPGRSLFARFVAGVNGLIYGSAFAVSTQFEDHSAGEIRAVVAAQLPDREISGG